MRLIKFCKASTAHAKGPVNRANPRANLAFLAFLLVSSGFQADLRAQFDANLGRIVGTVYGPDKRVIPDAEVVVFGVSSGARRTVRCDELGRFRVGSLRPGEYSVTATSPDFAEATMDRIAVSVGGSVRVDLELDLERTFTQIEVSAAMIDAMLPASSNVVGNKVFNDLPINGRRFHDFALLTPGVQVSRAAGHLSFGAQRGIYTNVSVDGTDYNQAFFGGIQGGERAGAAMTLPQSAIQEFQAVTSGFTAEYGRTTSGVVNVSTKSGSNELHGDAFFQIRHPRLGMQDPFGAKVLEDLRQFGGSAGGALKRDTAFWFFAIERQNSMSPRYVEFPLLDVADRSRGPEAFDYFQSLEEPFEATNDAIALTPRMDYQFSDGSQFMVRYNYSYAVGVNAISIGDPKHPRTTQALSNNGTEEGSVHFLTSQLTSVLTPNLVNQLRFTVTREQRPRSANSEEPSVSTTLGGFGTRSFLPTIETDVRPLVKNSLIIHAGSHDIKLGGEADRVWVDDLFGYNQFGSFRLFTSDPDEIIDILTPGGRIPNRFDAPGLFFRQIGNTIGTQSLGHGAIYVQDSWRAAPGLTLDLGFRWEGQFNQDPWEGNDLLVNRVRANDFPFGQVDPAFIPDSVGQWMPRVGFAYSPSDLSGRLVVRGSAGVFYGVTPPVFMNAATKSFRDPPFNLSVALPTSAGTVYQQFLAAGIDLNQYPAGGLAGLLQRRCRNCAGRRSLSRRCTLRSASRLQESPLRQVQPRRGVRTDREYGRGLAVDAPPDFPATRPSQLQLAAVRGAPRRPGTNSVLRHREPASSAPRTGVCHGIHRTSRLPRCHCELEIPGRASSTGSALHLRPSLFQRYQRRVLLGSVVYRSSAPRRRLRSVGLGPAAPADRPRGPADPGRLHVVSDPASGQRAAVQSRGRPGLERRPAVCRPGAGGSRTLFRSEQLSESGNAKCRHALASAVPRHGHVQDRAVA